MTIDRRPSISVTYSSDIRRTLNGIIREYGFVVCEPPKRVRGFLNDLGGNHPVEINLLFTTMVACRLSYFQAVKKGQAERLLVLKIDALHYELSITKEAAHWAVETWALALGIVETPLPRPVSPMPRSVPPQPPSPVATIHSSTVDGGQVPLVPCLPGTPIAMPDAPMATVALKQAEAFLAAMRPKSTRFSKVIVAGSAVLFVLFVGLITGLTHSPAPAQPASAQAVDESPSPTAALVSPDASAEREQALTQRIDQIRSGLEPGMTLIWPLDGKNSGMMIILPPKRRGVQDFLLGNADLHRGAEIMRERFEQTFRDAGYSEADVPPCSVFVCAATGNQLAFSTASGQSLPPADTTPADITPPADITSSAAPQTPPN